MKNFLNNLNEDKWYLLQEEILYVVDKLLLQPDRLCGLFIEDCGKSFNPFSKWNVTIPPKRAGSMLNHISLFSSLLECSEVRWNSSHLRSH